MRSWRDGWSWEDGQVEAGGAHWLSQHELPVGVSERILQKELLDQPLVCSAELQDEKGKEERTEGSSCLSCSWGNCWDRPAVLKPQGHLRGTAGTGDHAGAKPFGTYRGQFSDGSSRTR